MGYSMGGGATLDTSADTASIATYNIAAAVALHPITTEVMAAAEAKGNEYYGDVGIPTIPALIFSGADDPSCSYENILPNFEA
jgi:dienelactone hydrolase